VTYRSVFRPGLFDGETFVVTGGGTGIGRAIAHELASLSAHVALSARKRERLEAVQAELGPLDVLVSGAAGNFPARALDMSSKGFRAVVDIDLVGTFHVMRAGYGVLRKPGACVLNISAPQAFVAAPLQSHVCAAKAGVDMLTRVLALEWGEAGVRVNSIVPGPIADTEGMARLAPGEAMQRAVADSVPLKRMGRKEDVANLALAVASPLGAFINGAVLPVDGGWSLTGFGEMMHKLSDMPGQQQTG